MIILKTKTFANKKDKGEGKSNAEILGGMLRDIMEDERKRQESTEPKYPRRPNKKKDKALNKLHESIGNVQRDIEITRAEEELKKQQGILDSLKNPKPKDKTKVEWIKQKLSDPKTKKNLKIAGLTTLGVGATAGTIVGGLKLKKKIQERKKNQKLKEQIAGKEE